MSGWHEKGTFQGTNRVIIVFGITISTAKLCTRITQYVHSPLLVYSLTTLGYKLGKTVQISEALVKWLKCVFGGVQMQLYSNRRIQFCPRVIDMSYINCGWNALELSNN